METRSRLTLAAALVLLPLLPLSLRLGQLQIMEHRELESRAAGAFDRKAEEITPRADLLDRDGRVMAQSILVWTCFVDKKMVPRPEPIAAALGAALKLPAAEVVRRYKAQGRFAKIKERLSFSDAGAVAAARIEGVGLSAGQERFYPNGGLGRAVLGQTSADGRGLSGLELALDGRLRGKPRRYRVIRDGSGKTIFRQDEDEPPAPDPVRLTIDRGVQFYAEEALAEASARFSFKSGIVAVQDPSTGELLALAAHPVNPLKNPLVQDTYEPGSTFKIVTAAAVLEEGLVKDGETFDCGNGKLELAPGVTIKDHEPFERLDLPGILEHSSNIGTVRLAERLGAARFYRYARSFGFATKSGIPIPGETAGAMRPLSDMTRVGLAASSYGYGVGVSPLQLLGAYSAIASGGTLWEPTVLLDRKPVKVRRVASQKTMRELAQMLEGVVERGTATTAKIPGYRIAGKTGTARKYDAAAGRYSTTQYNASFVGFLPASKPLWTVLVVIEDPKGSYYGAQVAAPLFQQLARRLLALRGVPPDRPEAVAVAAGGRRPVGETAR